MTGAARSKRYAATPILLGGWYRDRALQLVVAEDHELDGGRRTGRVLVVEAEPRQLPPRRWYCAPADLTAEESTARATGRAKP